MDKTIPGHDLLPITDLPVTLLNKVDLGVENCLEFSFTFLTSCWIVYLVAVSTIRIVHNM